MIEPAAPPNAGEGLAGRGPQPPAGLYVHVPFCVSHCPYCDFVVVAGKAARGPSNRVEAFLAAVEAELELRADALDARFGMPARARDGAASGGTGATSGRPPLASVYLGGGTPSLLPSSAIARLLDFVRARYALADGAEVTLEVNPGPDERGDAAAQVAAGVTRVSIGAQSFDPEELRALGRRHAPADVRDAVRATRSAGAVSVSLDLLYDVPGQTARSWAASLDAALALDPDHLSVYALALDDPDADGLTGPLGDHLPSRPGARRWRSRARTRQDEDRAADCYEAADRRLADAGFAWYEISNWARPGHESRHNLAYWEGRAWEAVGPGAHAFDGATRRWNAARLDAYVAALSTLDGAPARLPPGGAEPAAPADAVITALRTRDGLPAQILDDDVVGPQLAWALEAGLLARRPGDRVALTMRGRLLSNEVFARLV